MGLVEIWLFIILRALPEQKIIESLLTEIGGAQLFQHLILAAACCSEFLQDQGMASGGSSKILNCVRNLTHKLLMAIQAAILSV